MIDKLLALLKQDRIRNFLFFSSASFISAIIGVITLKQFTYYMPPQEFGIWSFVLTFNSFISSIIVLDLHSYFLIEAAKNPERKKALLSTLVTFSFGWSILLIAFFLGVGALCFDHFFTDIQFYPYIAYILISNVFVSFSLFLQIVYRIENKPFYYFLFSIFQSVFATLFSLLIVMFFIHDAQGRILGYSAGMIISGIVAFFVLRRHYTYRFTFDVPLIKKALKFSAPLIPYSIAVLSMDFLDRIFIEQYGSITELGLFGLANQINTIIYFIFISLIRVYEPSIIVWIRDADHQRLSSFALKYNLLLILSSIGLMLVSGLIIFGLTNERYYNSIGIVIKMSPFFYLKTVSLLLLTILISGSKTFKTMYISLALLALYLLFGFIFIPTYGLDGMILIKTLIMAVGCVVTFLYIGQRTAFLKLALSLFVSAILIFVLTFVIHQFHFYI